MPDDPFVLVPGFGCYRVRASDGRVQSSVGRGRDPSGASGEWFDLKGCTKTSGFVVYTLIRDDGRKCAVKGCVVVATTFLGPCPDGMEVVQKNGVRSNDSLSNLEYRRREKSRHQKMQEERRFLGRRRPGSKLDGHKVREIRGRVADGESQAELAREMRVSPGVVNGVVRGRGWKNIG